MSADIDIIPDSDSNSRPHYPNFVLSPGEQPPYLKQVVATARFLAADLTRVYYWDAGKLLVLATEARWVAASFAEFASAEELQLLDLASEMCYNEIDRRDALVGDAPLRQRPGYVYLLSSPFGFYKIGCSSKPKNRLMNFGVLLPFEVECLCLIYSADMYALEKQLHQRFADHRTRGEWFELTSEDIDYVRGLAT